MKEKVINLKKLSEGIKKYWGAKEVVVKRTGKTRKAVDDILKGRYKNLEVLRITAEVLKEFEDEEKRIAKLVDSI